MKRYFRTKDGKIYDTNRYAYVWTTPRFIGLGISVNENILVPESSLVSGPTDNLEEICDEFIVLEYGIESGVLYRRAQYSFLEDAIGSQMSKHKCSYEIYGAIWIKGERGEPILKSVAKMNEKKGDLELL